MCECNVDFECRWLVSCYLMTCCYALHSNLSNKNKILSSSLFIFCAVVGELRWLREMHALAPQTFFLSFVFSICWYWLHLYVLLSFARNVPFDDRVKPNNNSVWLSTCRLFVPFQSLKKQQYKKNVGRCRFLILEPFFYSCKGEFCNCAGKPGYNFCYLLPI